MSGDSPGIPHSLTIPRDRHLRKSITCVPLLVSATLKLELEQVACPIALCFPVLLTTTRPEGYRHRQQPPWPIFQILACRGSVACYVMSAETSRCLRMHCRSLFTLSMRHFKLETYHLPSIYFFNKPCYLSVLKLTQDRATHLLCLDSALILYAHRSICICLFFLGSWLLANYPLVYDSVIVSESIYCFVAIESRYRSFVHTKT
jgi:hypothetical protein